MARSIYRGLVRLQSYVEPAVAERVDRFCAATGLSESTLLNLSLRFASTWTAPAT
jgi:hypothetical protein